MVCRTQDSALQTQGQCHISRSWDLPFNFVSAPYLLNPLIFIKLLTQMFSSVRRSAGPMTQLCRLKVKVTFQVRKRAKIRNRYNQAPHQTQGTNGKVTRSWDLPFNFMSAPYLLNLLKDLH